MLWSYWWLLVESQNHWKLMLLADFTLSIYHELRDMRCICLFCWIWRDNSNFLTSRIREISKRRRFHVIITRVFHLQVLLVILVNDWEFTLPICASKLVKRWYHLNFDFRVEFFVLIVNFWCNFIAIFFVFIFVFFACHSIALKRCRSDKAILDKHLKKHLVVFSYFSYYRHVQYPSRQIGKVHIWQVTLGFG